MGAVSESMKHTTKKDGVHTVDLVTENSSRRKIDAKYNRTLAGRYRRLTGRNRRRGEQGTLSFEEYQKVMEGSCHYCRGLLSHGDEAGVGLDRIDHRRGYTVHNVVRACGFCNALRGAQLSVEETMVAVEAILRFRGLG